MILQAFLKLCSMV